MALVFFGHLGYLQYAKAATVHLSTRCVLEDDYYYYNYFYYYYYH